MRRSQISIAEPHHAIGSDHDRQFVLNAGDRKTNFIEATFQELLANDPLPRRKFDFIFSSLAIHHLTMDEKSRVYEYVYNHLNAGSHFLNYDIVIAPASDLENWCMSLWRLWIEEHPEKDGAAKLMDIPEKYQANTDNIPDSLSDQLEALRIAGFEGVDCFSNMEHLLYSGAVDMCRKMKRN